MAQGWLRQPQSRATDLPSPALKASLFSLRQNLLLKKTHNSRASAKPYTTDPPGSVPFAAEGTDPLTTTTYPDVLSTKFSCLSAPPEPLVGKAKQWEASCPREDTVSAGASAWAQHTMSQEQR